MRLHLIAIVIGLFSLSPLKAQDIDSVYTASDTLLAVSTGSYAEQFIPRKASLYSAIFPGMGQVYNKKYWKLPLVYGGFTGLVLGINHYHGYYTTFRADLFAEIDGNDQTMNLSGFNEDQLRRLVDRSRRERDFLIIMTGLFYLLQIADAHIDAHLKEFDLNPELQVQIKPKLQYYGGLNSGLSLTFNF